MPPLDRGCEIGGRSRVVVCPSFRQSSTTRVAASCRELTSAHERQSGIQKPHARLDVATVVRPEGENASRHAVLERRAGRRDVPGGQRRRRGHAVIDGRDRARRSSNPPNGRRRQLTHEQQIHGFGKRQPAHHLVDRVAADVNRVGGDRRQRRLPAIAGRARLRTALDGRTCDLSWLTSEAAALSVSWYRTDDRRSRRDPAR